MKRLSITVLIFSCLFTIFVLAPPFLSQSFGLYPLMKVGDILDLFTPLLLIPIYWLLFSFDTSTSPSLKENLVFLLLVSFWILGQGMHLAANSIGHVLEGVENSDVLRLTGFYDETLSHYLWHFGVISLSGLILYSAKRSSLNNDKPITWVCVLAGLIYGFTFFAMVIEGATVPMGLPLAILIFLFIMVWVRRQISQQPVVLTFLVGYSFAIVLFVIWGIWQQGFPEFSQVGFLWSNNFNSERVFISLLAGR